MAIFDDDSDETTVVRGGPGAAPRRAAPPPAFEPPGFEPATPASAAPRSPSPAAAPGGGTAVATLQQIAPPAHTRNPLIAAANPLLALIVQLRGTTDHPDPLGLQHVVINGIKQFEEDAVRLGARGEDVRAARYVLCSVLDETVLGTPWGYESEWSTRSLLSIFHNETWGGEKVFLILDRVKQSPERYIDLLELIDVCLALGFEGRYRVMENGLYQFEEIRDDLLRIIRSYRGEPERALSPHWEPTMGGRTLRQYIPLWAVFAFSGALVVGLYFVFDELVSREVEPAVASLQQIADPGRFQTKTVSRQDLRTAKDSGNDTPTLVTVPVPPYTPPSADKGGQAAPGATAPAPGAPAPAPAPAASQ